jgi:AraC family transcriptional activator of tynA and feaB
MGAVELMHSAPCAEDFAASNESLRRICGAYQLTGDRWWEFRGGIRTQRIGTLDVADVTVSRCCVVRDQRDTHYLGDHYFLVFQMQGSARMRQCGVEAVLQPGDSTLIDSRFPSVFEAPAGFRQISFHFPTQPLRERLGTKNVPSAQRIRADGGAGRLLSDMLRSFIANAASLERLDLTDLTLQLLSAALGVS